MSNHTLADLKQGRPVPAQSLLNLAQAAEQFRQEQHAEAANSEMWLDTLEKMVARFGNASRLAAHLGVTRQYVSRMLSRQRPMTAEVIERLKKEVKT